MMTQRGSPALATGFTLMEMLIVLAISSMLVFSVGNVMRTIVQGVRMNTSLLQLIGILAFARQQAIMREQTVSLCGLHMRRNYRLNGCRYQGTNGPPPWQQGVLVYGSTNGQSDGHYDRAESLRSMAFANDLRISASRTAYHLDSNGHYRPGQAPHFTLQQRTAPFGCAVVLASPAGYPLTVCRGRHCAGCR